MFLRLKSKILCLLLIRSLSLSKCRSDWKDCILDLDGHDIQWICSFSHPNSPQWKRFDVFSFPPGIDIPKCDMQVAPQKWVKSKRSVSFQKIGPSSWNDIRPSDFFQIYRRTGLEVLVHRGDNQFEKFLRALPDLVKDFLAVRHPPEDVPVKPVISRW